MLEMLASKVDGLELLGTRMPGGILDDSELTEGPQLRDRLRPDSLVFGDTVITRRPEPAGLRRGGRKRNAVGVIREAVTIMDVGYGSDTRYHAKLAEKNDTLRKRCVLYAPHGAPWGALRRGVSWNSMGPPRI